MTLRCLHIAVIGLALALACQAQPTVVSNLSACPTSNELFSEEDLEGTLQSWLNDTLSFNRTACTSALQILPACSTDGTNSSGTNSSAALSSLRIQQGCCSSACAAAVEQALVKSGPGCYRTFLGAICDSAIYNSSLSGPMFSLTQRCLGLNASCAALGQPGDLLFPDLEARIPGSNYSSALNSSVDSSSSSSSSSTSTNSAGNASSSVNAGSTNATVTANRTEPVFAPAAVVPSLTVPDPYRLIPQQSGPASDSFLATPEEIEQAARQSAGAGTRRMLGHIMRSARKGAGRQ